MKIRKIKKNSVSPLTKHDNRDMLRNLKCDMLTPGKKNKEKKSNAKSVLLTVLRLHKVTPAGNVQKFIQLKTWLKAKNCTRFPHGLENLENGTAFSSQGILNRLEKWGNFTPNTGKVREF